LICFAVFEIIFPSTIDFSVKRKPMWSKFAVRTNIVYNTCYEHFEEFKAAVLGFFAVLSTLSGESMLGKNFRSRIRDRFRPIGA
jgi:hypothetical protein